MARSGASREARNLVVYLLPGNVGQGRVGSFLRTFCGLSVGALSLMLDCRVAVKIGNGCPRLRPCYLPTWMRPVEPVI